MGNNQISNNATLNSERLSENFLEHELGLANFRRSKEESDAYELFKSFSEKIASIGGPELIVSSIGNQSVGKSFLLNHIFGTHFGSKFDISNGKCTFNLNSEKVNDFTLFDLEGRGSNSHACRRDHTNYSLAFTFSKIVILHIKYEDIIDKKAFLDSFSFTYWLAIKKIHLNSLSLAKTVVILRDVNFNKALDDDAVQESIKKVWYKFCEEVNQKIQYYNDMLRGMILNDKKIKNKEEFLQTIIPDSEKYQFRPEFCYPIFWDNTCDSYKEVRRDQNRRFIDFDKENFLANFSVLKLQALDEMNKSIYSTNEESKDLLYLNQNIQSEQYLLQVEWASVLISQIETYYQKNLVDDVFLFQFYLGIESDPNFSCSTYDELELMLETLTKILISSAQKNKELMQEINSKRIIDVKKYKNKHREILETHLDCLQSIEIKRKVIQCLVLDSAILFNQYLGFSIVSVSNSDYVKIKNLSAQTAFRFSYDFKNLNSENLVIYLMECIINLPDNHELINTEFDKIDKAIKMFQCLVYFNETLDVYNEKFKSNNEKNFFMILWCLFNRRCERIFNSELDNTLPVNLGVTESKINSFNFQLMNNHFSRLISKLNLCIINEFDNFFALLENYFNVFSKIILLNAEQRYYQPAPYLSLFFERGHTLLNNNIKISTVSSFTVLAAGFTIRAAGVLYAGIQAIGTVFVFSTIMAQAGVAVTLLATGIAGGLLAIPIVTGGALFKWGRKKYQISQGLIAEFTEKFEVGKEIERDLNIINMNSDDILKNCEFEEGFPKNAVQYSYCKKEFKIKRKNENYLSAVCISYYNIQVVPKNLNLLRLDTEKIQKRLKYLIGG